MYKKILVTLDGSDPSRAGGELALKMARRSGAEILACHVYGAELHNRRFIDMEPGLAAQYQDENARSELRLTHTSLITDGLSALSRGYMNDFLGQAQSAGVEAEAVDIEGRNFSKILETAARAGADLITLGAYGLGYLGDGQLGGTVNRVLRHAECDVLAARRPFGPGPVLAGIDGSDAALKALERAAEWANGLNAPLTLAAAYDPHFHRQVFKVMARSLEPAVRDKIGLERQEKLHEEIIDSGLGTLYQGFLGRARQEAAGLGIAADTVLLEGKAYRALADQADRLGAVLVVAGRRGHHHEEPSLIGSNAEALVRTAQTNVLVTGTKAASSTAQPDEEFVWTAEALARLERVPSFARAMARRGVEDHARRTGRIEVTLEVFLETARKMGMHGDNRD